MRNVILATLIIIGFVHAASASDHNRGLKITGNVNGWKSELRSFANLPGRKPETMRYLVMIEVAVSNEGDGKIIAPFSLAYPNSIRFMIRNGVESVEMQKQIHSGKLISSRGGLPAEPPSDRFRILDPGDILRFGIRFEFVVRPEDQRWMDLAPGGPFLGDRNDVRRWLSSSHFVIQYNISPPDSEPDLLRLLADRWKKFGILPLDENGEFRIESNAFPSNTEWIRSEELP